MAVTTEQETQKQPPAFDAKVYIDNKNKREQEQRSGKPAEASTAAAGVVKPAPAGDDKTGDDTQHDRLPRSARREMNRLREEAAELRGRLAAMKELGALPATEKPAAAAAAADTKPDDPEPQRKDYADDAQYQRAAGRWEARQETKKALAKHDEKLTSEQQQQQFRDNVQSMAEKAIEDRKLFEDWDTVATAADETEETEFTPSEHPMFTTMLALSDVQAGLYYHFAKNPTELKSLLELTAKPDQQIKLFHRLEGRIEKLYYTDKPAQGGKETKAGDGAVPSKDRTPAAEATKPPKLPKPSESAAARGGSTPSSEISPYLADGKTMNPAWKEQRNQREGLRR